MRCLANSNAHFQKAYSKLPLGVSSNFRYWGDQKTIYIQRGKGGRVWDIDGNEYIDYRLAYGPIILGYESGSSAGTDNFGNTYYWGRAGTHDTSVKGMGIVTARSADTQFGLNPGQSRNATFTLVRYNAVAPIGDAWTYDVVIDELEILPGQQVRTLRQNSLNFRNVSAATTFSGTAANAEETANKVIDLFKKLGN